MGSNPHSRILFLVTRLDVGGAERYLLRLVRFLVARGWAGRIDVVCRGGREGTLADEFRAAGVRIIPLRLGFINPITWWRLRRLLSRSAYQAVCDFSGDFAAIPLLLARTVGIPHRVAFYRGSTHHFRPDWLRLTYWRLMHFITLRCATALLSNSYAAFDFFCSGWRQRGDMRFEVIRNGIDIAELQVPVDRDSLRRDLGIPEGAYVVGHLGRYNEAKNHGTILKVAKSLTSMRDDVVFLLCGRGVRENLQSVVREMGLEDKVVLQENRDDVAAILQCLDIFYFPSITEGQPNALIEAVLAKVPFVASDIPPHRECLPDWLHSRLTPAMDVTCATQKLLKYLGTTEEEDGVSFRAADWARETYAADTCFGAVLPHLGIGERGMEAI